MRTPATLRSLSDVRQYLYRNETPVYYFDLTSYFLMGMDEWIGHFRYATYVDCFDGAHPRILLPSGGPPGGPFATLEEINNHLLRDPAIVAHVRSRGPGVAAFMLYDEETEELCRALDLEICFPPLALRREVDGKVTATRIADEAGVASVPNALGRVEDYDGLRRLAGHLGPDLVIQTPFGDSGTTTYFVSGPDDFEAHAAAIRAEAEVKIMKRIRCRASAMEACVTRAGTIVGPLMTEIVGFPELTPYGGGWAGNEVAASTFDLELRRQAADRTLAVGEALRKRGYRGYFEIDYLQDRDDGSLYLGEINPRITGASGLTNLAAFAHADAPLFLFHLLEFSAADFDLDIDAINARWSDPANLDDWSQLIIKYCRPERAEVVDAPPSGVWEMGADGSIRHIRMQTHRRTVERECAAFFLRMASAGEVLVEGEDIGFLIARGRLMTEDYQLTERAQRWIAALRARFVYRPRD